MKNNSSCSRGSAAFLLLLVLLAPSRALAQTAQPPDDSSTNEKVLTLDAFTVTSEKTTGYRATNSISATGIGMAIGETPIAINVVTKDLIDDTRSDLVVDALRFVPGVTNSPTNESQPGIRGFTGNYLLRNGVFRRQNLTTWNVERIEVIQGPSGLFYSNVRPGGMLNYITSAPVLGKNFADIKASVGDNDYYRGEGAFNATMGKNAAVRIVVGHLNDDSFRKDFTETQDFISGGALWEITPNHKVWFEATSERTYRYQTWSAYAAPLTNSRYYNNPAAIASGQSIGTWMTANFPTLPRYDMFAPFYPAPDDPYGRVTPIWKNSFQSTVNRTYDFTYTGKLTDKIAVNVVTNRAYENNQGLNPAFGDIFADGTFHNAQADWFINIRKSYNLNSKVVYKVDFAGMKHSFMAGNDNQWVVQEFPLFNGSGNLRGPIVPVYDPRTMKMDALAQFGTPVNSFNTVRRRREYYGGNFILDQMSAFNERFIGLFGARKVNYEQKLSYVITQPGATPPAAPPKFIVDQWTPQLGAMFKLGGGISAFASYSRSVEPQLAIDITAQRTVDPISSKGYDLGFKINSLGGALTGTINYYSVYRSNVAIADSARNTANGVIGGSVVGYYFFGNAQQVRGVQGDMSWSINRSLQVIAGWNHFMQVENVAPQASASLIGVPLFGQPPDTGFLWLKYQPVAGTWKGFFIGGGIRYNSDLSLGGDFNQNGVRIPAFTVVDGLIGYQTKLFDRPLDLRLNVKNLFDKIYREGGSSFATTRRVYLSASMRF